MKKKYVLPIIALGSILCLTVGILLYNHFTSGGPDKNTTNTVNDTVPTKEQIKDGENTKANTVKEDQQSKATPDSPSSNSSVSVYTSAIDTSGDAVVLRFVIDGVHSGTCELGLTKGSGKITKTVPVQALAASSTCQGYTIAKTELSNGTWSYVVTVVLNGVSTESHTSGEFELQ